MSYLLNRHILSNVLFQVNNNFNKIKLLEEEFIMDTNKIYAEHIANEYSVKKESKVIALKKLDRKAKLPANVFAYTNGIIMSLILGIGMCLSMNVIGNGNFMILGIIIGILGIVGVSTNYFSYKKILEESKAKYAQDIIRLAEEITKSE